MKKLTLVLAMLLLSFSLVGCGNSIVKKSIEKAQVEINNREYEKALVSLELALDEDKDNKIANTLYNIINTYKESKVLMEENKLNEAKEKIDSIDDSYKEYKIKEDIEALKESIEARMKEIDEINKQINELQELINEESYNDATTMLKELLNKNITSEQSLKLEELNGLIEEGIAKIQAVEEAKRIEEEKNRELTQSEAIELIKKEDSAYMDNKYVESIDSSRISFSSWGLSFNEKIYTFIIYENGESEIDCGFYIVSAKSKEVYRGPHQGGIPIYKIKNNSVIETYGYSQTFTQYISESSAEQLVINYLKENNKYIPSIIEVDHEEGDQYVVHCYDIVVDHTATSGWYYVSKYDGTITSMF